MFIISFVDDHKGRTLQVILIVSECDQLPRRDLDLYYLYSNDLDSMLYIFE